MGGGGEGRGGREGREGRGGEGREEGGWRGGRREGNSCHVMKYEVQC